MAERVDGFPLGEMASEKARVRLAQLLVEINKEEAVTLMVVTHSRELAKQMGRVLELQDGRSRAK